MCLQVNQGADDYRTDHHSVIHMLCEARALSETQRKMLAASTVDRVRYDAQNAPAYKERLAHELSIRWLVPTKHCRIDKKSHQHGVGL